MYTKFAANYHMTNNKTIYNYNGTNIEMQQDDPQDEHDDDDSIINSLPDMSEYGQVSSECQVAASNNQVDFNITNKFNMATSNHNNNNSNNGNLILSPRSSISSVSSSSNSDTCQQINGANEGDIQQQPSKKIFNRNIHCVKEKIRRDRIKFSCNELRRLIPNLNGVKTDMASLLETSVLWIQLINANIPEQLLINVQSKLENLKLLRSNQNQHLHLAPSLKKDPHDNIHLKQETYSPLPNFIHNTSPPQFISTANEYPIQHNAANANIMSSKPSKWLYSNRNSNNNIQHDMNQEHRCFIPNNATNNCNNELNDSENQSYYNSKIAKKPIDYNNNSMYLDQLDFTGNSSQNHHQQQSFPPEVPIVYCNHLGQVVQANNGCF